MKYHTTLREIIPALLVTLLLALLSSLLVLHCDITDPAALLSDHLFSAMAEGENGRVRLSSFDRRFFSSLVANDVLFDAGEEVSVKVERITIDKGLASLSLSLLLKRGCLTVTAENPVVRLSPLSFPGAGKKGPSLSNPLFSPLTYRFILRGGTLSLSADGYTCACGGLNASLSLNRNFAFSTLLSSFATLSAQREGLFSLSLDGGRVYYDEEGNASIQVNTLEGKYRDARAKCSHLIANGVGDEFSIPWEFSLQDVSLSLPPLDAVIPLVSGNAEFVDNAFSNGTISISNAEGTYGEITISLPTSSYALRSQGGNLSGAFASSPSGSVSLSLPGFSLRLDNPEGKCDADLKGKRISAEIGSPSLLVDGLSSHLAFSPFRLTAAASSKTDFSLSSFGNVSCRLANLFTLDSGPYALSAESDGSLSANLRLTSAKSEQFENTFDLSASYSSRAKSGGSVMVTLESGDSLSLEALVENLGSSPVIDATARTNSFSLLSLKPLIDRYAPYLHPYIDDGTKMSGDLRLYTDIQNEGRLTFNFAMKDIPFGAFRFSCGLTGNGELRDNLLSVDYLTFAINKYRLYFHGNVNVESFNPSGLAEISDTETGEELLTVNFSALKGKTYSYQAMTSLFPSFLLGGEFTAGDTSFSSEAVLLAGDEGYPLSFTYTFSDQMVHAKSGDSLILDGFLGSPLTLSLKADNFPFPRTKLLKDSRFSTACAFLFETREAWSLSAEDFSLSGVVLNGRVFDFLGAIHVTPSSLSVEDLSIREGDTLFSGRLSYGGAKLEENIREKLTLPFEFSLSLSDGSEQKIALYLARKDAYEAMVDITALDLGLFIEGAGGVKGSLRLVGKTDLLRDHDMRGDFSFSSDSLSGRGNILLEPSSLAIRDASFSRSTMSLSDIRARIAMDEGSFSLDFDFADTARVSLLDDTGSSAKVSVRADFAPLSSLLDFATLKSQLEEGRIRASLSIDDLVLLGEKREGLQGLRLDLTKKNGLLLASGNALNLSYSPASGLLSGSISKETGFGCSLSGTFRKNSFTLSLTDVRFDLRAINRVMKTPIVTIREGIARGSILLDGSYKDPQIFGKVTCDSLAMTCFYTPDDILYAKNVLLWSDGASIKTAMSPGFSLNTKTGKTSTFNVQYSLMLNSWTLEEMNVDLKMNEGEYITFYLPLPESMMEISASVNGEIHIRNRLGHPPFTGGKVSMRDAEVAIGELKRCPSWYAPEAGGTAFDIEVGQNCHVFYPNTPSPVFSATIQEGETFSVSVDPVTSALDIGGSLSIKNGEIFSFQKNFYITEGNISVREGESGLLEPLVNLRAKLRDFDANGNPVDIYLVLNGSTLANFNPTFESSPAKPLEEIMSILGQSILPSSAYGSMNLYRVASVASFATDVAERMGLIDSTSLSSLSDTIRDSLGLDMFTLHSSILQNILIDALPGSSGMSLSPIARYLNNTSIFLGKYVGRDMFLQLLLHLQAVDPRSSRSMMSFLSSDLALNLELSLEWNNPLCTYSIFTKPKELSLTQFLDTIGFSVSRRIVLF